MLKKISILLVCIFALSGCSQSIASESALTNSVQDFQAVETQDVTISDTATQEAYPQTAEASAQAQEQSPAEEVPKSVYDHKDNVERRYNLQEPFDESLFWNYCIDADADERSRGFIIPIERLSDNYELYVTASELLDKKLSFESKMNGAPRYEAVITDDNPLVVGEYYEAAPEYYFGCTNVAELNEYYRNIYVGDADYKPLYDFMDNFKDIDGKLHVLETGGQHSGFTNFMEWNDAKFVICDETEDSAVLVAGVPHWSGDDEYYAYSFYGMELVKTENGWRFADNCLWYY